MRKIDIDENGLHLEIEITEEKDVRLIQFAPSGHDRTYDDVSEFCAGSRHFRLVEIQFTGMNRPYHHGDANKGSEPGYSLKYFSHNDFHNNFGRKLEIIQEYRRIFVTSHLQFFDGIKAVRSWTSVENKSEEEEVLEYLSSFALTGLESGSVLERDKNSLVYLPHNTWFCEAQWKSYSLNQLGYDSANWGNTKTISLSKSGTWASSGHLPMGSFENKKAGTTFTWQIETSGSWNWEISDKFQHLYLQLSGPSLEQNGFVKILKPGQTFESVPCAIACIYGNFEKSIQEITKYRRAIRRPNKDNALPSVIFNDYMNCLMGDPTTEKEIPLIDAAAEAGCKYYCIDCGWYDDGPWWDGVGEWLPSKARFPGKEGIKEVLDYIRKKGMIPGLWLELEVMGIKCPLAKKVPKDWFFQRNGKILMDENRYQLDFRNPQVREHATKVVSRLVEEYGAGYIKMDYNLDLGVGTDLNADSAAEGMLEHKRAYLAWLDQILDRYPDLVFENCSSGGMRMEYSLLSRCQIQSVTDQEDYIKMAAIAANAMTAVTPEQAAIWSYPLKKGDQEETAFNMVNAILMRIHQSGHLAELSRERLALVQEGIQVFKKISPETSKGLPFFPLGLATMQDNILSCGVDCGQNKYLAVWCTKEDALAEIPLSFDDSVPPAKSECIYPSSLPSDWTLKKAGGPAESSILQVKMKAKTARLFRLF